MVFIYQYKGKYQTFFKNKSNTPLNNCSIGENPLGIIMYRRVQL